MQLDELSWMLIRSRLQNGGHCQPMLYLNPEDIAYFELSGYALLKDLVDKHNIPCDLRSVGGIHAFASQEEVDLVARRIRYLQQHHPYLAERVALITDPDALSELRVPQAAGAVLQTHAARLWPYKLVAWILEDLLSRNGSQRRGAEGSLEFNLQTHTPVTRIQKYGESWIVHTTRGQIAAKDVLLATNGYTSHLLPELTGLVVPVRGQVSALDLPEQAAPLEHTHVWMTPEQSDDYLIHRDGRGPLIVGGERLIAKDGEVGVYHDDEVNSAIAEHLRRALHSSLKLNPLRSQTLGPSTPRGNGPASWATRSTTTPGSGRCRHLSAGATAFGLRRATPVTGCR